MKIWQCRDQNNIIHKFFKYSMLTLTKLLTISTSCSFSCRLLIWKSQVGIFRRGCWWWIACIGIFIYSKTKVFETIKYKDNLSVYNRNCEIDVAKVYKAAGRGNKITTKFFKIIIWNDLFPWHNIQHTSLFLRYRQHSKNLIFRVLWAWMTKHQLVGNFDAYLDAKKQLCPPTSFLRYYKDVPN